MNTACRCPWVDLSKPDYVRYHDLEWGVPVRDDRTQFEFLLLESAQAGLSWYTVLRKRENYRQAFAGFDPATVARFGEGEIENMLLNSGLIRNRAKLNQQLIMPGNSLPYRKSSAVSAITSGALSMASQ